MPAQRCAPDPKLLTLCSIVVMSASWKVRAGGSAARLAQQMRGHFVTQFTAFISELVYKAGALSAKWDQALDARNGAG